MWEILLAAILITGRLVVNRVTPKIDLAWFISAPIFVLSCTILFVSVLYPETIKYLLSGGNLYGKQSPVNFPLVLLGIFGLYSVLNFLYKWNYLEAKNYPETRRLVWKHLLLDLLVYLPIIMLVYFALWHFLDYLGVI